MGQEGGWEEEGTVGGEGGTRRRDGRSNRRDRREEGREGIVSSISIFSLLLPSSRYDRCVSFGFLSQVSIQTCLHLLHSFYILNNLTFSFLLFSFSLFYLHSFFIHLFVLLIFLPSTSSIHLHFSLSLLPSSSRLHLYLFSLFPSPIILYLVPCSSSSSLLYFFVTCSFIYPSSLLRPLTCPSHILPSSSFSSSSSSSSFPLALDLGH